MISKILKRQSGVGEASWILSLAFFGSSIFGLLRDRTLLHIFGAGQVLDAYNAALRIPDLIFKLLILSALSSVFIPIFSEYLNKKTREEAWEFVNSLLNLGVIVITILLLVVAVLAPEIAALVAPGFTHEGQQMVAMMMRIMLLSPLFFGLGNLAGGILNSFKNFIAFAFAPILYNIGIILGALFLVPKYGFMGLAYGVAVGAFLQLLIQVIGVWSLGYRYHPHFNLQHPAIKRIGSLMVPRVLSLAVGQFGVLISTIIASELVGGSITNLNAADNLYQFPVTIFGFAFATAVFPTLADNFAKDEMEKFRDNFFKTFRQIIYLVIPTAIAFWLLRAQLIRLFYETGQFTGEDVRITISILAYFTFGMVAQSLIPLLARGFFAVHNTVTPFIAGLASLIVNIVIALYAVQYLQVVGLALAISVAATVNAAVLFILLAKHMPHINWNDLLVMFSKVSIASIGMGGVGYLVLYGVAEFVDPRTFMGLFIQTALCLGIMGLTYLSVTKLFAVPEIDEVFAAIKKKFTR